MESPSENLLIGENFLLLRLYDQESILYKYKNGSRYYLVFQSNNKNLDYSTIGLINLYNL